MVWFLMNDTMAIIRCSLDILPCIILPLILLSLFHSQCRSFLLSILLILLILLLFHNLILPTVLPIQLIIYIYRIHHFFHILILKVNQVQHLPLPLDIHLHSCFLQYLCHELFALSKVMTHRDIVLFFGHRVKSWMSQCFIEFAVRFVQHVPGQKFNHQDFFTYVGIVLELF